MKYLELSVEMPIWARHPMQEFCRGSDMMGPIELLTWNVTGEGEEYALFYIEGDLDAYRNRIEMVESVHDYNLTPIDDNSFYSYVVQQTREADQMWRQAFMSRNLVVIPPIVYNEDTRMTLTVVGDRNDLQALINDFPEEFELKVEHVGDYDHRHATIAAGLTDRQLEAIETAVDLGYYAVPREASLEAIANELGCAESTVSNHLRKAEAHVMCRLVRRIAS